MKNTIRKPRNTSGYISAVHTAPMDSASSLNEAVQLLNGSGEVLISARVLAHYADAAVDLD